LTDWAAGAARTAAWVRHAGVDSVALIRLSSYRKVLAAAAGRGAAVTRWPTPREERRGDPVDGVFWWTCYPPMDDVQAVAEWIAGFMRGASSIM
jgi:hypothetical protein